MKVSYFAFDIFDKSNTAGYVHTKEITDNMSKYVDLRLTLMPPKKDFINPFLWSKDGHNYSKFTLWFKPYLIPALPMNLLSWLSVYEKTRKFHDLSHNSKNKIDIIHERFHSPNPFGVSIFKKLSHNSKNIKRVLEVNSPYVEDSPYRGLLKQAIKEDRKSQFENCDAIITQTETLKNIISLSNDCENKKIHVVSNGVNTDLFKPMKTNGFPDGWTVICFSGSFQKWHGIHLIPEIMKRIKNAHFLFIGSGKGFEKLIKMKLERTMFVDTVDYEQLPYYLNMADVFIAPFDSGEFEYFDKYGMWWNPMKLYEYLAVGQPAVSFAYPEIEKIVGDAGLLAKVGDLDDFIDKLQSLVDDVELRRVMGEKARNRALECSWDKKALETIKVYDDVLSP